MVVRATGPSEKGQGSPWWSSSAAQPVEKACVLVHGLRPHIEVAPIGRWSSGLDLPEALVDAAARLKARDQVRAVSGPELRWTDLGWKPVWRVEVHQPFMVPELRRSLEGAWALFAADIPFTNRLRWKPTWACTWPSQGTLWLAVRTAKRPSQRCAPLAVVACMAWTSPCDAVLEDLQPTEAFPSRSGCFFDLETSIADNRILCAAAVVEDLALGIAASILGATMNQLLEGMTRLVLEQDPDIITGYNIDNFDLPRIAERVEALGGRKTRHDAWPCSVGVAPLRTHRTSSAAGIGRPKRASTRAWTLGGRCVMDAVASADGPASTTRNPGLRQRVAVSRGRRAAKDGRGRLTHGRGMGGTPRRGARVLPSRRSLPLDILHALRSCAERKPWPPWPRSPSRPPATEAQANSSIPW